jgi:uncharacterized repeat protein (TIGR03803 family)
MTKLKAGRMGFVVFLLFSATAIGSTARTFKTLAKFDGTNGTGPMAALVQGRDGNFYGTTYGGGTHIGTVFKITPAGKLTKLVTFNTNNGAYPYAGLVLASDGNLYGTAERGGANGCGGAMHCGTVFKITPAGKLTTLYNFCSKTNCEDGWYPESELVEGTDGNLYGTTTAGGTYDSGTIYRITLSGKLANLYSFSDDGSAFKSGLVQATDGSFYGTTWAEGTSGMGTVFRITPSGDFATLYSFCSRQGCVDGRSPRAGLLQAGDGNFYGTTTGGGTYGGGTVFKITPGGTLTTLHSFCVQAGCPVYPWAALTQGTDGNLYGTTSAGGANPDGVIFTITLAGKLTVLYSFDGSDGAEPYAKPIQATNGIFYGTAAAGGSVHNYGVVYSFSIGLGPFVTFVRDSGKVGWRAEILGQGFTGTTAVSFNGTSAAFNVISDTYLTATVPDGATTGPVTVTTPKGVLKSNVPFRVIE